MEVASASIRLVYHTVKMGYIIALTPAGGQVINQNQKEKPSRGPSQNQGNHVEGFPIQM